MRKQGLREVKSLQRVTWLGKAVVAGAAPQPSGTWELGNVTTHLADKGQLQRYIEDDLGVTGRQLLGSVWGEAVTGQQARTGHPVCAMGLQHASPGLCAAGRNVRGSQRLPSGGGWWWQPVGSRLPESWPRPCDGLRQSLEPDLSSIGQKGTALQLERL